MDENTTQKLENSEQENKETTASGELQNPVVSQLPEELTLQGRHVITEMLLLIEDLNLKKAEVAEQLKVMKETLAAMAVKGAITFDQKQFKRNEDHVAEYTKNISNVIEQLSGELYMFSFFVAPEVLDQKSDIFKQMQETSSLHSINPETVVATKIPMLKQLVKRLKRDVSVNHSRYCHSFDTQMQQLFSLQRALKSMTK